MISITKEEGDKILEEFLVEATKQNGSSECAQQSFALMNDNADCHLLLTIILKKMIRESESEPAHILELESSILSALTTVFTTVDDSDIPSDLKGIFEGKSEEDIFDNVVNDKSINFAVQAFVGSFLFFKKFEEKYSEIVKAL